MRRLVSAQLFNLKFERDLKMKVKLKSRYASAKMNAGAGSIIDVPEKEAVELVGGGFAEYCKESKVDAVKVEPVKKEQVNQAQKPVAAPDKSGKSKK